MAPPLIARSNDGSLIAIHYHQDSSNASNTNNRTSLIRCYDGNVSNGSLKFTLRVPAASSEEDGTRTTALSKMVFSNTNSHLCVMQQTSSSNSILIYDLDRGVLATTLDVRADNSSSSAAAAADTPKKKKARKSMNVGNEVLCDIATGTTTTTTDTTADTTDTNNQLYALVDINGKCRLYQYDLVGKKKGGEVTLVKKIKVGSIPASSSSGEEHNGSSSSPAAVVFGLTVSKDVIVVRLGSTVRVHDVNSGEKLGKIDLPGDVVMAAASSSSIEDDAKKFVPLVITSDGKYIVTSIHNQAVVLSCGGNNNKDNGDEDEFKLQMVAVLSTKDDTSSIVYLDGASTTTTTTVDNDKKLMVLAFQPTVGIASLFSVTTSSGGKKEKKASSSSTSSSSLVPQLPQAQLETKQEEGHASYSYSSLVFTHAGFHPRNPNEAMLLLFQRSKSRSGSASGSGTSLPMESLPYNNADDDDDASPLIEGTVTVGTSLLIRGEKNANKDGKNKRKAANSNDNVALAPGDQGQEAGLAQDLTSSSLGKKLKKARKGGDDGNGKEDVGGDEDGFDDLEEEEEDGEPGQSIAERLALLSSAMEQTDEEDDEDGSDDDDEDDDYDAEMTEIPTNFKPNSATSETLTTLLTQALSSNDSNQLNIALQVTDRRLVEGTIRALQSLDAERAAAAAASLNSNNNEGTSPSSSGYISTLMAHIVRRMARRHSLVMPLGVWVKAILAATARSTANVQAGSAVEEQMAREGREMAMKLGPLKNFLNERVECFPQLLRLEGRLALLSQQL